MLLALFVIDFHLKMWNFENVKFPPVWWFTPVFLAVRLDPVLPGVVSFGFLRSWRFSTDFQNVGIL